MTTPGHLARIMQKGEFVVGTTGNMPPLNMTAKDGEVIGFEMDIVRMMAKAVETLQSRKLERVETSTL